MSGHSKWSTIKHKKAAKDAQKGKIFTKLSRVITVAVLEGGGIPDPDKNVKLRLAIEKAREASMPKENIQRAIEKGHGPDKATLKEYVYEGFGPEGTALMILVTTDNSNRSISEVRNMLDRQGGKMGSQGSVSYLFQKCGYVVFEKAKNTEDKIYEFADAIASFDIEEDADSWTVYFPFESLGKVSGLLGGLIPATQAELDYKPLTKVMISDEKKARRILEIVEHLEELDDVQKVYGNFDLPEAVFS